MVRTLPGACLVDSFINATIWMTLFDPTPIRGVDQISLNIIPTPLNSLKKLHDMRAVRERTVYEGDAELLLNTMKEMEVFAGPLEDQAVVSELADRLREKRRQSN